MNQNSILEKYQYLRDIDALVDIQLEVLATDATTPEELDANMPDIKSRLSDYPASLITKACKNFITSLIKPKHSVSGLAHMRMWKQYMNDLAKGMEEGRPVVGFFGGSTAELFPALGVLPIFYEAIAAFLSVGLTAGVEDDLDESEEDGFATHLCGM
jgi:hypothetical protein